MKTELIDRIDPMALGETTLVALIELHPNASRTENKPLPTPEQLLEMGRTADPLGETGRSDPLAEEDPVMTSIRESFRPQRESKSQPISTPFESFANRIRKSCHRAKNFVLSLIERSRIITRL